MKISFCVYKYGRTPFLKKTHLIKLSSLELTTVVCDGVVNIQNHKL